MFCMLGGIFAVRWLSYSVASRGVVKILIGKHVVELLVQTALSIFPWKHRLKICHRKFITFFTQKFTRSKDIYHLVLTLGPISRKVHTKGLFDPQNWSPEVFNQARCSRTFACRICPE